MHFEFLTEDKSGKTMLEILLPRLLPEVEGHTYNIHHYKGIGRIPKKMRSSSDPQKRILLAELPRLLAGYGKVFEGYGDNYRAAVIVVCDLDDRNQAGFLKELQAVADAVTPCPKHRFCLAVEEGEAWYLGDLAAISAAYPSAKKQVLARYVNDSICGTWELLADAVFPGGAATLGKGGWHRVGLEKSEWAKKITPFLDIEKNQSPSFQSFVETMRRMTSMETV